MFLVLFLVHFIFYFTLSQANSVRGRDNELLLRRNTRQRTKGNLESVAQKHTVHNSFINRPLDENKRGYALEYQQRPSSSQGSSSNSNNELHQLIDELDDESWNEILNNIDDPSNFNPDDYSNPVGYLNPNDNSKPVYYLNLGGFSNPAGRASSSKKYETGLLNNHAQKYQQDKEAEDFVNSLFTDDPDENIESIVLPEIQENTQYHDQNHGTKKQHSLIKCFDKRICSQCNQKHKMVKDRAKNKEKLIMVDTKCKKCGRFYCHNCFIEVHEKVLPTPHTYIGHCPLCGKQLGYDTDKLVEHTMNCKEVYRPKDFKSSRYLYACFICQYHTHDKYAIKVHLRTHTQERLFPCPHCSFSFIQKVHLTSHIKSMHQWRGVKFC